MEPSHFDRRLKLLFLTRLISLCEHNYNLVELGPRGTGKNGLVTFYVLAVMQMKTRRVQIAGITPSWNAVWMRQVCRSLTDCEDGFLKEANHLIVDRDTSFRTMRDYLSQNTDTEVVLLPPKSRNLNAYMERWFRSLKSESLNRIIFFGKRSLERAVAEYAEHYQSERNHQGLQNSLIEPDQTTGTDNGTIDCRERLGGMLKYYHRLVNEIHHDPP
jgi:hypothetical protein